MIEKDRLKFFKLAHEINNGEKKGILRARELHCRGNVNSMSLISLNEEKSEKGFSGIKTKHSLLKKMDQWMEIEKPNRPTPEKKITSMGY
ncbi:MAG: hypothetical protein O6943_11245 [Bacteroidetes bacterium]|nr:hypothetical protein [Bacteroidota bacterium]